jgi:hypothetical protein
MEEKSEALAESWIASKSFRAGSSLSQTGLGIGGRGLREGHDMRPIQSGATECCSA